MPPGNVSVATSAPPLAVGQADGLLLIPLGLHGIDWLPIGEVAPVTDAMPRPIPHAQRVADWPTVSFFDLDGPGFLLAGRDDQVRFVVSDPPGSNPQLRMAWTIEGLANAVAVSGDLVAVAGGGGGLGLWDWHDRASAPDLRGRYPFIGFGRDVVFLDPRTVAVADSMAGDVVLIDVSDPMRPRRAATFDSRSGFVDQLAFDGTRLAFTDRLGGLGVVQRTPPMGDWSVTHRLPEPPPGIQSLTRFLDVTQHGGTLILCADEAGWMGWQHQAASKTAAESWQERTLPRLNGGGPVAAAALGDGRVAVALAQGGVEIVQLEQD